MFILRADKLTRGMLKELGVNRFFNLLLDDELVKQQEAEIRIHHSTRNYSDEYIHARAVARVASQKYYAVPKSHRNLLISNVVLIVTILLLIIVLATKSSAQTNNVNINKVGGVIQTNDTLKVNCTVGCSVTTFADRGAFTLGTTAITNIGGIFDDTPPAVLTAGMAGVFRVTDRRALHINFRNSAGTEIGTLANPIRIDPTGTTAQPVTLTSTTITGNVAVTGPLTDAQLRATPVPVSGTITVGVFPDNEPINVAQMNGVAVTMGNGIAGTGVQRVAIASDNTAFGVNVGTFPDNEPINIAQINGVAPLMGNGISGTGALRVTQVSDGTGTLATVTNVATIGTSVTPGTAATNLGKAEDVAAASGDTGVGILAIRKDTNATMTTADAEYVNLSADNYGVLSVSKRHPNALRCTQTISTATILTVVPSCTAPGAGLSIYVTDISFSTNVGAIAADTFNTLKYGTGGACGTGTTVFWGAMTAATTQATVFQSFQTPIKIPANNEVCWINSTAGSKFVIISGFIAP